MSNFKIVDNWTFNRKLPKPFDDYTDDPSFKEVYSKYCTQPRKKSTLHAASLQAILSYMEPTLPKLSCTLQQPVWRRYQPTLNIGLSGRQTV